MERHPVLADWSNDLAKIPLEFTIMLFGDFTLLLFIHFFITCLYKSVMTPMP